MNHEHYLTRRSIGVHDDFVNQDPDDALLQPHVGRGPIPERWEIPREGMQRAGVDLPLRDRAGLEGGEPMWGFQQTYKDHYAQKGQ